jgi:hypothetical protein
LTIRVCRSPLRGVAEIRTFFARFIETIPAGFLEACSSPRMLETHLEVERALGRVVGRVAPLAFRRRSPVRRRQPELAAAQCTEADAAARGGPRASRDRVQGAQPDVARLPETGLRLARCGRRHHMLAGSALPGDGCVIGVLAPARLASAVPMQRSVSGAGIPVEKPLPMQPPARVITQACAAW